MRKHIIAVTVLSALSVPAFAQSWPVPERWQVTERIELKDGKMAMECKFGHALSMKPGQTMQTKDGRTITMVGNETVRIELQNPLLSPRYS